MRTKRWITVAGICLGLVLILGFIKFMQIRAAIAFGESFPEPSETVEIRIVEFSQWQPRISVIGEARASREVALRNEVEGIVAKIGFVSGGEVKQGDILLQLDISEEQAQLEAIQPQIELARQNVKRISGLADKSAVSRQQADNFNSQLAISRAQAASVKEVIANKTVVAPFSGTAGLHDFEIGEYLSANTLITNLVGDLDTLWIDFSLPQRYAGLKTGTPVSVRAPDVTDIELKAEVVAVEPNISSVSRNLRARATLIDPERRIKPGTIVRVFTPVDESERVVRLPSTAVRTDTLGSYVFLLNKDAQQDWRAQRRPVTVRAREEGFTIISDGLTPGEVVATTGSFKLSEGLLVYQSKERQTEQQNAAPAEPFIEAAEQATDETVKEAVEEAVEENTSDIEELIGAELLLESSVLPEPSMGPDTLPASADQAELKITEQSQLPEGGEDAN